MDCFQVVSTKGVHHRYCPTTECWYFSKISYFSFFFLPLLSCQQLHTKNSVFRLSLKSEEKKKQLKNLELKKKQKFHQI